jgi:hypothetical protein
MRLSVASVEMTLFLGDVEEGNRRGCFFCTVEMTLFLGDAEEGDRRGDETVCCFGRDDAVFSAQSR